MDKDRLDFTEMFKDFKREFKRFADSYTEAVKNGADAAGDGIAEALEDRDRPVHIVADQLIAAVKKGVQSAGEQMIASGVDFVEHIRKKGEDTMKTKK